MSKKLILLIGAPGSGKTTDAKLIAQNHSEVITSYSLGLLLRDEIEKGGKLGKIINGFLSKGDLVPTAIIIDVICASVSHAPTDVVILDGFPRLQNQMKIFADIVLDTNRADLVSVIEIKVSDEVARERYFKDYEDEAIFEHSMSAYKSAIADIETFYTDKHILQIVDGEQSLEKVLEDTEKIIKSFI